MITLEKLKIIIDSNFGPPFLPEGMVTTKWSGPTNDAASMLNIYIGERDIQLDEDGIVLAAGTLLTGVEVHDDVPLPF